LRAKFRPRRRNPMRARSEIGQAAREMLPAEIEDLLAFGEELLAVLAEQVDPPIEPFAIK
jgi:hypothetical protein